MPARPSALTPSITTVFRASGAILLFLKFRNYGAAKLDPQCIGDMLHHREMEGLSVLIGIRKSPVLPSGWFFSGAHIVE